MSHEAHDDVTTPVPDAVQDPQDPHDPVRRWRRLAGLLSGLLVASLVVLAVVALPGPTPGERSPEVGFSRDMIVHHEQATTMAFQVLEASDDPSIDTLAVDMVKSQAEQQGMFLYWLRANGVPSTSDVPMMTWMHGPEAGDHHSQMQAPPTTGTLAEQNAAAMASMGMASDEELAELGTLQGRDAEVLFLQLMIRHHRGGVLMAEDFVALSDDPGLRPVADAVITSQNRELTIMTNLLEERGAQVDP